MIIEALLDMVYSLISFLTGSMSIPTIPDEIFQYIQTATDYLIMGAGILSNYTPFPYLLLLFGIIIYVDIAMAVYHLVMWILNKIPVIDID